MLHTKCAEYERDRQTKHTNKFDTWTVHDAVNSMCCLSVWTGCKISQKTKCQIGSLAETRRGGWMSLAAAIGWKSPSTAAEVGWKSRGSNVAAIGWKSPSTAAEIGWKS